MAWIGTVSWADSSGALRDAYDWQASKLGEPAEFTMLGSLYPRSSRSGYGSIAPWSIARRSSPPSSASRPPW
ncbi:MAG: hypothetical protein F4110_01405 [Acidimicrobiaceae bacterium]|nr:hypothetical protein [Acidimicrobiaceae bacterium]MXZ52911.1 hypothetical protein [Acidimicrobiaceae bacterium]MXZ99464.1 hypothetical protein [Acidimicrobiaceae bacterium]MYE75926.1 hypothetical protein [Acidimicrobiaceae bacterium]MYE95927.1 hypothetical protein [Acidimicrobiaceae bacterium]